MWDIIRSINEEEQGEDEEGRKEALAIIREALDRARKQLSEGKTTEAAKTVATAVLTYLDTFGDDTVSAFAGYTRYEVLSSLANVPESEKNLIRQLYDIKNSKRTVTKEEAEAVIERTENLVRYMEENPAGGEQSGETEESSEKRDEEEDGEMSFNEIVSAIEEVVEELTGKKLEETDFLEILSSIRDKVDSDTAMEALNCYRLKKLAESSVVTITEGDAEKCKKVLDELRKQIR